MRYLLHVEHGKVFCLITFVIIERMNKIWIMLSCLVAKTAGFTTEFFLSLKHYVVHILVYFNDYCQLL